MFQRSNNPTYKKLWNNVVSFNSSSLVSLSPDHNYHLNKVYEGNYAYVIGITPSKVLMREHCDVTIAKETFAPLYYSVGLQKNSAYTKEIDRM